MVFDTRIDESKDTSNGIHYVENYFTKCLPDTINLYMFFGGVGTKNDAGGDDKEIFSLVVLYHNIQSVCVWVCVYVCPE